MGVLIRFVGWVGMCWGVCGWVGECVLDKLHSKHEYSVLNSIHAIRSKSGLSEF